LSESTLFPYATLFRSQFVVQPLRRRGFFSMADGSAIAIVPALGVVRLTQCAVANAFDGSLVELSAAPLHPHLHHSLVPLRGSERSEEHTSELQSRENL